MTNFSSRGTEEVNTQTAGDQTQPYIAALAGGGWVVVWTTPTADGKSEVHGQVIDASGAPAGGEFMVGTANPWGHESYSGLSVTGVAGLADGTFVVTAKQTFSDRNQPTIELDAIRMTASGTPVGGPSVITSQLQERTQYLSGQVLPHADGSYTVFVGLNNFTPPATITWGLYRFDASGTSLGHAPLGGNGFDSIAQFSTGNLLVGQTIYSPGGPSSVQWDVVTPSGEIVSHHSLPRAFPDSNQSAAVAVLAAGEAVLVWNRSDGNTGAKDWHLQFLDAGGNPVGDAHVVPLEGGAFNVELTPLADGGFVMSWQSNSDPSRVYAQHYDASGFAAGDVTVIDAALNGANAFFSDSYQVLATPDGGFLYVAQDQHADSDIDLTKFDAIPGSGGGNDPGHIAVSGDGGTIPAGNYTITGSAGIDTISFSSAHDAYAVTQSSISGPEGNDTLSGIERIEFSDGLAIALDVHGDAGEAYRLYQAAFDRAPDLPGLGYHIHDLDNGVPLWLVAQHFIDSPEFQSKYGATTNTQFITLLYENVLHREPEPGGMQYHQDEFARGETRADMLTHFSESPENQANVIGAIGNGMLYVPLG